MSRNRAADRVVDPARSGGSSSRPVKLVILHSHYRPGGVRRIIELAAPPLLDALKPGVAEVVLAGGEQPPENWLAHFHRQIAPVEVACWIEPALGYLAEQRLSPRVIRERVRRFFAERLDGTADPECVVWAHNQGLGRNLLLTRELTRACCARGIPLVLHHHDWWFDNRWQRWPELRQSGFRTLGQTADAVFVHTPNVRHATINGADSTALRKHLGRVAGWLPNLVPPAPQPDAQRVAAARRWLNRTLGERNAPVWLVPCRLLRRKNLAEALLLTRWLRPRAWLVTTGAASSADEAAYAQKLTTAARRHGWRLRLSVLAGDETQRPAVPDLLAASEAVLLTSVQEGFGLPYLEASAARRPLVARLLPNIAPDLRTFGFRFPQSYTDVLVPTTLFDWERECTRQRLFFDSWLQQLPCALRRQVPRPAMLKAQTPLATVPFSRLTVTAQLEVLARPVDESWRACAPFNPFLEGWRNRARARRLQVTPWPRAANRWLGPRAYGTRFVRLLRARPSTITSDGPARAAQDELLTRVFAHTNLYPLLWRSQT